MPPKPMPSEWGGRCRVGPGFPACEGSSGEARFLRALHAMRGAAHRDGALSLDGRQERVQELSRGAFAGGYC